MKEGNNKWPSCVVLQVMHQFDRQRWAIATTVLAAVMLVTSSALAQGVSVEVNDLTGGDCNQRWATLRVLVTNHGSSPVTGELSGFSHSNDQHELRQSVTLGPRESYSILVEAPPNTCDYSVCFDGGLTHRSCANVNTAWEHSRGNPSLDVLLIQRNLELRPALSVSGTESRNSTLGAALAVRRDAPRYFDLPLRAHGYQHMRFVALESDVASELSVQQRTALTQWVRTGGVLVIVAASAEELLRDPVAAMLAPDLTQEQGPTTVLFSSTLSNLFRVDDTALAEGTGAAELLRFNAPTLRSESSGSRIDIGLGVLHFVIAADRADVPGTVESSTAARAALDELFRDDRPTLSTLWRGAPVHNVSRGELDNSYSSHNAMSERRMATHLGLDPNQADRLPLWIFFIVVLATTAAVFFFQHRWSRGGRRVASLFLPALAIAVLGCSTIFGLAYASRGAGERYRSMAWIEGGSGEGHAIIWRRLALAIDSPGEHELSRDNRLAFTAPRAVTPFDTDSAQTQTATISGNRWQTIIAAEHGVIDLDGAVEIDWSTGLSPIAVHNGLDIEITDARLIHNSSSYQLGTLQAGARIDLDTLQPIPEWDDDRLLPTQAARLDEHDGHMSRAALLGTVDLGCPDRGDFEGEQCTTTILVWGQP